MTKKNDYQSKQSNISLIASILSFAFNVFVGFFISPVVVRDLGVEANGLTQLANNFVSYATLITIALNSMSARFITISYHQGDFKNANKYYTSVMAGNLLLNLLLIFPAIILIHNIDSVVNIQTTKVEDVKILFALTFGSFFVSNIYSVYNVSTTVKNKHYLSSIVTVVGTIIRISILVFLFSCFEVKLFFVSLAGLIATIISLLETKFIKNSLTPEIKFRIKNFSISSTKNLLFSGIWSVINKCGELLMTGFDLILTNLFVGSIHMGVLSVAKTIPASLISLVSTVSWNWNPKMLQEYADGNIDKMLKTLDSAAKITTVIASIPITIFSVFAFDFYLLWMPTQNAKELTVLSILTIMSYYLLSGSSNVYNIFTITNKLKVNTISFLAGAIISFLLSLVFVKYTTIGIYAIAGVSSIVILLRNIFVSLPYAAKCIGKKWYTFYKYVFYNGLCSASVAVVALVVKMVLPLDSWIGLSFSCCVSGVISFIILSLIIFGKEQRKNFLNNILRKKAK